MVEQQLIFIFKTSDECSTIAKLKPVHRVERSNEEAKLLKVLIRDVVNKSIET